MADATARASRFQCDNCGAELAFDAASRMLKCAHCGSTRPVAQGGGAVMEHDLAAGLAAAPRGLGTETRIHRCQECGANVSFPAGVTATKCTFCGSSKVLDQGETTNAIRPESVVPFSVDKKVANQRFGKWLSGLWFRPGDLKRLAAVQEVNGVYVPFWTFDAHVDSEWTAERGRYYYVDEEYTTQENGQTVTKTRQRRETEWHHAWGHRSDDYDDLLVCASQGLPEHLVSHFKTFEMGGLVPYSPEYLAGWRAEEYAIDLQAGWSDAQGRIVDEQERRCGGDVGGDTHRDLSVTNYFSDVTFKHVLLPVWIAAYRYNQKVYRFLVNGQTGEVVGKAPWSVGKILLFIVTLAALVTAIVLLVMHFKGNS